MPPESRSCASFAPIGYRTTFLREHRLRATTLLPAALALLRATAFLVVILLLAMLGRSGILAWTSWARLRKQRGEPLRPFVLAAALGAVGALIVGALMLPLARTSDVAPRTGPPGPHGGRLSVDTSRANTAVHRVFFATDRTPAGRQAGEFGTSPMLAADGGLSPLSLGWCDVQVPLDRHHVGAVERPTWWTLDWRDWREDPERHFVIVERRVDATSFWPRVSASASADGVLLFIHGFNVAFDDAVFRTAQLTNDLAFHGAALLYSWSSAASPKDYVSDKENNEATVPLLKEFLIRLAARTGAGRMHIIAHSMGNRALMQALTQLANEKRPLRVHQIMMAAPDVDRRVFLGLAPTFVDSADRITLYASSADRALLLSKKLQAFPRAGDATPMLIFPRIESIDATMVSTDFLAHSYYSDPRLLNDFESLIRYNAALPRFAIEGVPRTKPVYWRFLPES